VNEIHKILNRDEDTMKLVIILLTFIYLIDGLYHSGRFRKPVQKLVKCLAKDESATDMNTSIGR
jgi:hypothetical protein